MSDFRIEADELDDGTLRLSLVGELDVVTVVNLEAAIARLREREGRLVVLDLRRLEFMDSSGLRAILRVDAAARESGGRAVLVRGSDRIAEILRITGVDTRLEIVDEPPASPA